MTSGSTGVLLIALALSSLGLVAGPAMLTLGRGRALTTAVVEGLTMGLLPTMVVLRLLPHVMETLGPAAFVLAFVAFIALRSFDRAHHRAAERVGREFIYSALALHSFTDGVSLAAAVAATPTRGAIDITLTAAFVVHRLPEGLFIATTLLPTYGRRRTVIRTLGLLLATIAGGLLGGTLLPHLSERLFDGVVALGLGAMLQLVLHSHAEHGDDPSAKAASSLAFLAGVAIAIAVPAPHDLLKAAQPDELSMMQSLVPLFIETAPMLLIGIVLTAALSTRAKRSPRSIAGALAESIARGPSRAKAAARALLAHGAPLRAVTTFAIAAPALGLEGVLVTARLIGAPLAALRMLAAALVAIAGGLVVREERGTTRAVHDDFVAALSRSIDALGAWYLGGLVAAAALEAATPPAWRGLVPLGIGAALVAARLEIVLVALAPIVAVLLHKGLAPQLGIAILLIGPTITLGVRRVLIVTTLAALALSCVLPHVAVPSLHPLVAHDHSLVERAAAAAVVGLLIASLLRLGPRAWFLGEAAHDH